MIVTIDIGNTNISLALAGSQRLLLKTSIATCLTREKLRKTIKDTLLKYKNIYPGTSKSILCSVVPQLNDMIGKILREKLGKKPIIVGKHLKVPIKNLYHEPGNVGQDRLVCAFAGRTLYGAPLILIDLGTAITIDCISAGGFYEGGIIIPGIHMSLESLSSKTALLPKISKINVPHHVIGKTTKESILSGIFNGYGQMISGLCESISNEMKAVPQVVLTGGHARKMERFIQVKKLYIDESLVLKGLQILSSLE